MSKEKTFSVWPEELTIREVEFRSPDYEATLDLRDRILRKPLGLRHEEAELAKEGGDTHVAVFGPGEKIVGCLLLSAIKDGEAKMRQVAVEPDWQGRGIGAAMTAYAESLARSRGARTLFCHARHYAVPFYERSGYRKTGDPFEEVGLEHWRMEKSLRESSASGQA